MLLGGNGLAHQPLAADEAGRAGELRQQTVIVAAALSEPAPPAVERQAGHHGKVNIGGRDERAVRFRL